MNKIVLVIIYSIAAFFFLFCSFIFSSSDMAFSSVPIYKLDKKISENPNKKSYVKAKTLASNYDRTISTILFLNDTVNAGLDSVSTLLGVNLCFVILGEVDSSISETWGLIFSLVFLVLKIIFGEIVPKSISKVNNVKLASIYANFINFMIHILTPITYPVSLLGKGVGLIFKQKNMEEPIAEEELHEMIDEIEEKGQVDEEKADMLHETVRFTHTVANEIMTPRVDVYAIDIDDELDEIINDSELYNYSRVPVYEDTIDNIIGYVQVKTLMKKILSEDEFSIRDILLEPIRFPDTKEINDILREFKKSKKQFALVIDEYGGLDGIITMEDILEEIVGEIWDEKDRTIEPIVEKKDGTYIIDGNVTLEDYCDLFDIDFDEIDSEYVSIGGYLIELLDDHFGNVGDEVDFKNTHIKIISVDDNGAINRILVSKIDRQEE